MISLDQNNFKKEVLEYKEVVLVDFYANWCNPCKMLSPLIDEMDKENINGKVKFAKLDIDNNQEIAASYNVMSIPTVIIFKNGKIVTQKVGIESKESYLKAISNALSFDPKAILTNNVIIFTTPTCPYCHMAKDYLKKKKVTYNEIDVSIDQNKAMQMYQKSGQLGVPQLWINDQVVMGFNKPQIDLLLDLH